MERAQQAVRALEFIGENTVGVWQSLKRPSRISLAGTAQKSRTGRIPCAAHHGITRLSDRGGDFLSGGGAVAEVRHQYFRGGFGRDLVLREISPLIVAILIAGRSGSAYAAEIGTMKVTEELDAVQTLGLSPIQLLVLPRVFALILALPLLTVYADGLGVFGGMLIASNQLNVSFTEFVARFEEAVALRHFLIGLGKAPFFAIIIALVGVIPGVSDSRGRGRRGAAHDHQCGGKYLLGHCVRCVVQHSAQLVGFMRCC